MSRFSRINTIWRKELIDTLRDRRTLVAMVLVPMVLYPALMLGSMQALEVQVSQLQTERYDIGVGDQQTERWLRRVIDSDPARREVSANLPAEERIDAEHQPDAAQETAAHGGGRKQAARSRALRKPPDYRILVISGIVDAVRGGTLHCGVVLHGPPPSIDRGGSAQIQLLYNETSIRSDIAASGLAGILERNNQSLLEARLKKHNLEQTFVHPLLVEENNVATEKQMTGSALGKILPLILIMMTLTGAIYPAIDLTAGERERGTLETLMVAPVPTLELIAGKFVVVTFIGLLSAVLNLLSIGGTVILGGVGSALMPGAQLNFPISALPLILLMLVPLAVMFSALLLAVCSFARSFKEAQNYIVPVMMAAMIPGVVGVLPGTQLQGPVTIMPVANIVVLSRELLSGNTVSGFEILVVFLSTTLYAGAAVAVAAKLFGQEAVLFADSGSVKTLFQRKFFKPRLTPNTATALLTLVVVYTLNFYLQSATRNAGVVEGFPFLLSLSATLLALLVIGPMLTTQYVRADLRQTFRLTTAPAEAWIAAMCFGFSTWVLVLKWFVIQQQFLKMDEYTTSMFEEALSWTASYSPVILVFFLAVVPAICEELFFRGFALSGMRSGLNAIAAVLIVSLAFGMSHYSAHRLVPTAALGLLFGILVVRFGSIWPAMLAHAMHNGISLLASRSDGLKPWLDNLGMSMESKTGPPDAWIVGACILAGVGVLISFVRPQSSLVTALPPVLPASRTS